MMILRIIFVIVAPLIVSILRRNETHPTIDQIKRRSDLKPAAELSVIVGNDDNEVR